MFKLLHAGVCVLFGYSAFIAFIVLKNYPSAILGFISGTTDSILFFLHYLLRKENLRQWYTQTDLRTICRFGLLVSSIGLLCLAYFTTIQIMLKKPVMPIPDSCVISIVWSFIAMRSGIFLAYYAIKYQNLNETPLLSNEEQNTEDTDEPEIGSSFSQFLP